MTGMEKHDAGQPTQAKNQLIGLRMLVPLIKAVHFLSSDATAMVILNQNLTIMQLLSQYLVTKVFHTWSVWPYLIKLKDRHGIIFLTCIMIFYTSVCLQRC